MIVPVFDRNPMEKGQREESEMKREKEEKASVNRQKPEAESKPVDLCSFVYSFIVSFEHLYLKDIKFKRIIFYMCRCGHTTVLLHNRSPCTSVLDLAAVCLHMVGTSFCAYNMSVLFAQAVTITHLQCLLEAVFVIDP